MVNYSKDTSVREGFGDAVIQAAAEREDIVVLGADVTGSLFLAPFAAKYPRRFISLGIAEQNIASVAAGLALSGFLPVMATYAAFCTTRSLDQIRVSICYNRATVLIAGSNAGISSGPDGATHQALEDIGVMRALPHMSVYSPSDAAQAYSLTLGLLQGRIAGPTYMRLGRIEVPSDHDPMADVFSSIFRAYKLHQGAQCYIMTTGPIYWLARRVADRLEAEGTPVNLLDVYNLSVRRSEEKRAPRAEPVAYLTVEEHQLAGGLGSIVAQELVGQPNTIVSMMGIKSSFGESGPPMNMLIKYGLGEDAIYHEVQRLRARLEKLKKRSR